MTQDYRKILANAARLQRPPQERNAFRISSAGKCLRALAYIESNYPAEPLDDRTILRFDLGHLLHSDIQKKLLVELAEAEVILPVTLTRKLGGEEVTIELIGHIDGVVTDCQGSPRVLEIKTMAEAGFKMFKYLPEEERQAKLSEEYACQHEGYRRAAALPGRVLLYNKNTSDIVSFETCQDNEAWERIRHRFTELFFWLEENKHRSEEPPESFREYNPVPEKFRGKETGRTVLPWNCSYCDYNKTCWPQQEVVIKGGKPVVYPYTV